MAHPQNEWGTPQEIANEAKSKISDPLESLINKCKELRRELETRGMTPDDKSQLIAELEGVIEAYDSSFNEVKHRLEQDDIKELLAFNPGASPPPTEESGPAQE